MSALWVMSLPGPQKQLLRTRCWFVFHGEGTFLAMMIASGSLGGFLLQMCVTSVPRGES